MRAWRIVCLCLSIGLLSPLYGQQVPIPTVNFNVQEASSPREVALSLQILFLLTIISLAPSLLILLTSFVRIYVVLSFVSRGLATQNLPPNNILISLSLFITLFVMFPVLKSSYEEGVRPYLDGSITIEEGYEKAIQPIRDFMFRQTSERYIYQFIQLADLPRPSTPNDVPTYVLIPAFVVNELSISFYIGVLVLVPFVIIDIVTASTLMSMGMMMLPPIMVSFPLKVLLFVVVDGWNLLISRLISGLS